MSATLTFDLSGLGIRLRGVPEDVVPLLQEEWAGYVAPVEAPFLDLRVGESGATMPGGSAMGLRLDATLSSDHARFEADEGAVELDAGGGGRVSLSRGTTGRRFFGLSSLVAAASGWTLARERGLALHAAGAVLDGRAFLLLGPSGAGKSTWAEVLRSAGEVVLTDDVVVLETGAAPVALSVPFRVRPHRPAPRGRWPVAALLLARQGPVPRLDDVPAVTAQAHLAASVLYVEAARRLDLAGRLARIPVRELTFRPDASFVPLLRSFALI